MNVKKTKEEALNFIKTAIQHKQEWKKELEAEFNGKDVNVVFLWFSKIDNVRSPHDPNISAITFIIIDEFFTEYENVLLYYCDSTDHREAGRNRLFIRWFEKAANPNRFTIRTTHAIVEGQGIYVAIIVENRNSLLHAITDEFDATAAALTSKP